MTSWSSSLGGPKYVQARKAAPAGTRAAVVDRRRRSPAHLDRTAGQLCYDPEDTDYLCVVAGRSGDLFLIPVSVRGGRTRVHPSVYPEYRVDSAASLLTPGWKGSRGARSCSARIDDPTHPAVSAG